MSLIVPKWMVIAGTAVETIELSTATVQRPSVIERITKKNL